MDPKGSGETSTTRRRINKNKEQQEVRQETTRQRCRADARRRGDQRANAHRGEGDTGGQVTLIRAGQTVVQVEAETRRICMNEGNLKRKLYLIDSSLLTQKSGELSSIVPAKKMYYTWNKRILR